MAKRNGATPEFGDNEAQYPGKENVGHVQMPFTRLWVAMLLQCINSSLVLVADIANFYQATRQCKWRFDVSSIRVPFANVLP